MAEAKCQWDGCKDDALAEVAARAKVATSDAELVELDVRLCDRHRAVIARGALTEVSLSVKPRPAWPRR